jgi:xylulose-5-phosphate/fructose-6-phosphate phosphoketolase
LDFGTDGPDWLFEPGRLGTIRLNATSGNPAKELLLGIGPKDAVESFLRGVEHDVVVDVEVDPFDAEYRHQPGSRALPTPGTQPFWATVANRRLEWEVEEGDWVAVVMNADGSRGVAADLSVAAKSDLILWVAIGSLAAGLLLGGLAALAPRGERRMSANPHANGGLLLRDLLLPDFRAYAVEVDEPGRDWSEATRALGEFLRDVIRRNPENFRIMGPDETASNRLGAVFEATGRTWEAEILPTDEGLAPDGRVMEVLSEHLCQGWLEGYLLTGRHGLFNCYEAFIHIVDSMFNQHAKWLKVTRQIPWRRPIASLNYLLTSHVWRQDHNGFSHQDPGFIDHVANKKAEIIRVYLPPDANALLSVADHCLRSRDYVNVIVAGKQPSLNYLSMDDAVIHCTRGIGIWEWASNDDGAEPDVVLGCAGDIPTLETVAAAAIVRERLPELRVRVVNVVDLMRLQPESEHPHGLSDGEFDSLFTTSRPIVFAYHGYPWLIHRLTYRRRNHPNLHVRGYKEEGTTTTPFDMVMLNDLDRFHLVIDVIDRVPGLAERAAPLRQEMIDSRLRARGWTRRHGEDHPDIRDWTWPF